MQNSCRSGIWECLIYKEEFVLVYMVGLGLLFWVGKILSPKTDPAFIGIKFELKNH